MDELSGQLVDLADVLGPAGRRLAWTLRGRWQCAHCGNRPGPFSWRCAQCRRWGTLRMETGVGAHGGPSGRYAHLSYEAEVLAWALERFTPVA